MSLLVNAARQADGQKCTLIIFKHVTTFCWLLNAARYMEADGFELL